MGNCQSDAHTRDQERAICRKCSAGICRISLNQTLRNEHPTQVFDTKTDLQIDSTGTNQTFDLRQAEPGQYHNAVLNTRRSIEGVLPVYGPDDPADRSRHPQNSTFDYRQFVLTYPEYKLTWPLDNLRKSDYARLELAEECYVDYMGAALYPESLIRVHSNTLSRSIMGNTHSMSTSSLLSSNNADEARSAILSFFDAPSGYTVVFTANASGALKLIGESFPFAPDSSYVLGADSHNSVHGIRQYAAEKNAQVSYIPATPQGGFYLDVAKEVLFLNRPTIARSGASLFALTAQSNVSNTKNPLWSLAYASSLGYDTLLDAAAWVPTSSYSLRAHPVDAMAISFYKMFGYPTGIGALIARTSFLTRLNRPWFSGGSVSIVQAPGTAFTRAERLEEQFEDGTVNYLVLSAITDGLRFLSGYQPFLPLRLSCLLHYLVDELQQSHHPDGSPLVRVLSRRPTSRVRRVGEESDTGFSLSFQYLLPSGNSIPLAFIEYLAQKHNIALRTGCMCNPGGAAALLGVQDFMELLRPSTQLRDFERIVGRELGVVRVSLGLASSFQDAWRVVQFSRRLVNEQWRQWYWDQWLEDCGVIGQAL